MCQKRVWAQAGIKGFSLAQCGEGPPLYVGARANIWGAPQGGFWGYLRALFKKKVPAHRVFSRGF